MALITPRTALAPKAFDGSIFAKQADFDDFKNSNDERLKAIEADLSAQEEINVSLEANGYLETPVTVG